MSPQFVDFDADGHLDIVAGTFDGSPHVAFGTAEGWKQPEQILDRNGERIVMNQFWNFDTKKWDETNRCDPAGRAPAKGHLTSAWAADLDGDGDLDLLLAACGGKPRLVRNDQQSGHHWLRVRLTGTNSNRDAIGAWVEAHLADGTVLAQQVMPTRSYLSQCELPVTFGLGTESQVARLHVRWPSGETSESQDVSADQVVELREP